MWIIPKNEKLYKDSGRKTNGKWDARETVDITVDFITK